MSVTNKDSKPEPGTYWQDSNGHVYHRIKDQEDGQEAVVLTGKGAVVKAYSVPWRLLAPARIAPAESAELSPEDVAALWDGERAFGVGRLHTHPASFRESVEDAMKAAVRKHGDPSA